MFNYNEKRINKNKNLRTDGNSKRLIKNLNIYIFFKIKNNIKKNIQLFLQ